MHHVCHCELPSHQLTACIRPWILLQSSIMQRNVCSLSEYALLTSAVSCRASLAWARNATMLLHSLVLCAAAACAVGLLCSSSDDISGIPAVNLRVVLALVLVCALFALQPFAHASALLAAEDASCEPLHLADTPAWCKKYIEPANTIPLSSAASGRCSSQTIYVCNEVGSPRYHASWRHRRFSF